MQTDVAGFSAAPCCWCPCDIQGNWIPICIWKTCSTSIYNQKSKYCDYFYPATDLIQNRALGI